jgi:hypothetical protein
MWGAGAPERVVQEVLQVRDHRTVSAGLQQLE